MRFLARAARLLPWLMAAALGGCGGAVSIAFFDDDGFFSGHLRGDGLHLPHGDSEMRASVVALAVFDSLAGIERLMAAAAAHGQLAGPAGTAAERLCATGSLVARKTASAAFVVEADNCQLVAGDPLVYDGAWLFTIESNGYAADGSCPAAAACVLTAALDVTGARFGYGRSAMRATGSAWRQETSAAGVLQVQVQVQVQAQAQASGASTFIDGVQYRPAGTLASLSADEFSLSGDSVRRTLSTTAPMRATISTDATGLVSAVDETGDGVAERSYAVPWDRIVD